MDELDEYDKFECDCFHNEIEKNPALLEEKQPESWGNYITGVWYCFNCNTLFYPSILKRKWGGIFRNPPICDCGCKLIYDEIDQ